jgi:hypothetical protein
VRADRRDDPFLKRPWFSPVEIPEPQTRIDVAETLYFGGSCFAENLFREWRAHFLPGNLSPFGSTYNPVSLAATIERLCGEREITDDEIFEHRGLWRHSLFNTLASRPGREEFLSHVNTELKTHREYLRSASRLVLTLGTAFVYREMSPRAAAGKTGEIVNDCHQRPSSEFSRSPLDSGKIVRALRSLRESLSALNPACSLMITLSPVRHLRDGAAENSLSKSLLRCGIQEYLKEDTSAWYFPSYEIMLDELRDYRWYASDLCHPSGEAASYIIERFFRSAGSPAFQSYLEEARKIKALKDHQIRFPDSPEAADFIAMRDARLGDFRARFPFARLPSAEGDA